MPEYKGIKRYHHPNWLGWTIIDLLEENKNASEEHIAEIKQMLELEVKLFYL